MQKTQIIYKGIAPKDSEIKELKNLMPSLDIKLTRFVPEDIRLVTDPFYKIKTVDWVWLRSLFSIDNDIDCLCLEKNDLAGVGVHDHWGFYSLDGDMNHQFYMSNLGARLEPRAKANGFTSNFVWMFVHEYLHGARWEETKDRQKAAQDVHDWEKQGVLKAKLAEYMKTYGELTTKVSLLESVFKLTKSLFTQKKTELPTKLQPLVERQVIKIIESMELLGMPVRLVEGFRSNERQNQLYAQGRTTAGNIVTNAKGGESYHNYGVAVDFVFRKAGYNATDVQWKTLGAIGKQYGFEWGGDENWVKAGFVDKPHFEMTLGYSLKDFQQGKVDYSKYK